MKSKDHSGNLLFNVRLPADLVASWKRTAQETRMSQTEITVLALRFFLNNPDLHEIVNQSSP